VFTSFHAAVLYSIFIVIVTRIIQKHVFSYHWHTSQPFIPAGWLASSCSHLSLLHGNFQPSPGWPLRSTQPCQDRSACGFSQPLLCIIIDQLNFTHDIARTARSCRFALYNIRKIRSFLLEHATQLVIQVVQYRLDQCNVPWPSKSRHWCLLTEQ